MATAEYSKPMEKVLPTLSRGSWSIFTSRSVIPDDSQRVDILSEM